MNQWGNPFQKGRATAELKGSNNRFAPVILAQLHALEKNNPIDKLNAKISLTKDLFSKGWKKEDIRTQRRRKLSIASTTRLKV